MRVILRIARLELASLFFSPIAWLVLVVFAVQYGLHFTDKMDGWLSYKTLGYPMSNLSEYTFTNKRSGGLLAAVQSQLYLFVPLLTMGVLSREISSGSIKLLLSSPIKVSEIVLGKFLGILGYGLILMVTLSFFVIAASFNIEAFELKWMLTSLLGLYLLFSTYTAIGLFLSSLTSYQVVAAISTLAVLTFLNFVGGLWQDVDFLRHITYFLSAAGKADNIIYGLIRSKDIIYFIIVITLFLGLTMLKLQAGRESRSAALQVSRYLILICTALLLGYVSALPALTGYVDLTSQHIRTLTANSRAILEKIDQPLTITTYVNLLDRDHDIGMPKERNNDMARFEHYQRFLPHGLKMEYVYYYDTCENSSLFKNKVNAGLSLKAVAENAAKSEKLDLDDFLSPAEIRKQVDLSGEGNKFVRRFQLGDQTTFLRLYNDFFKHPGEDNITAAIKRLTVNSAKVVFITGNHERSIEENSDRGYKLSTTEKSARTALINHGFDGISISLKDQEIPKGIAALVLADPRTPLTTVELDKINKYIADGGNLLILGKLDKQELLKPILDPLGIGFLEGMIVQNNADVAVDLSFSNFTNNAGLFGKDFEKYNGDTTVKVVMARAGALSYKSTGDFKMLPLLVTNPNIAWLKTGAFNSDSLQLAFKPQDGDQRMTFPTALALTREKGGQEQKIVVISDADFMSNLELNTFRKVGKKVNSDFYKGLFRWFSNGEYPITAAVPESVDNVLTLESAGSKVLKVLFLYLLPGLLLAAGVGLLYHRKRK